MTQFRALNSTTEIRGQMMIDFEEALNSYSFLPIIKKHGFDQIQPDQWYPIQQWLDVLSEINDTGGMLDFVSIGMQQIENHEWPPEVTQMGLVEFLEGAANEIYHTNYRGPEAGRIYVDCLSETQIAVVLRVPEPDDLWYGNLYALARQFLPPKSFPILEYEPGHFRRDYGGDTTRILITTEIPMF